MRFRYQAVTMIAEAAPFRPVFSPDAEVFASGVQALYGVAGNDESWILRQRRFDCGSCCDECIAGGVW